MNRDLRRFVHDRLSAEALLQKNWSRLVLAACDGRAALDGVLQNTKRRAKRLREVQLRQSCIVEESSTAELVAP